MAKAPSKKPAGDGAQDYIVRSDGWVAGQRAKKGDIVRLTPAAARYENVDPAAAGKAQPAKQAEAGQ